ncbi:MAG: hypothetical protein ABW022_26245 [Actinoplanes sp.]
MTTDPASAQPAVARWGDAAVGAVYIAEEIAAAWFATARRAAALPDEMGRRFDVAASRGATERARARLRLAATLDATAARLARTTVVDRMVDAQLDRVLRPLVTAVLDDVLALLEREPERIQALVRGQRDTMVDELVGRIRSGAAAGDSAVDRLTARMLRRDRVVPAPVPAPPLE